MKWVANEIRIKISDGISDTLAMDLVHQVMSQGKASNNGKMYCYLSEFNVSGQSHFVRAVENRKTTMFYVFKKNMRMKTMK